MYQSVIKWTLGICRCEAETNVIMKRLLCVISLGNDFQMMSFVSDINLCLISGVKAVFSGHYHRNAGGCHDGLDMVVSSAVGCQLGNDTHGVRVVVVTEDDIIHRYHSLDQLTKRGMDEDLKKLLVWNHLRLNNHAVMSLSSTFILETEPLFEISGGFFLQERTFLRSVLFCTLAKH